MTTTLAVIPAITETHTGPCVASILDRDSALGLAPDELLLVDNSRDGSLTDRWSGIPTYRDADGHNLGVARSWNVAARIVVEQRLDYLTIISASMLFGPTLHTTWRRQIEAHADAPVIEASGHSWHLIALHRSTFEQVGYFDENFYPAYFESIDWCRRLQLVGLESEWPNVWVNALSQGVASHNDVVSCPAGPLLAYYRRKWGGDKGAERFDRPFGRKPLGYWQDVPIRQLAHTYRLGVWW